jgi:hypothetical protein
MEHQKEGAKWALDTIRNYGLAYLAWEERTRKTGTALLTVEMSKAKSCLIITTKKALDGWREHFKNLPLTKEYELINYHSVHKIKKRYDFIILDEAHTNISAIKPSTIWKRIRPLTKGKPILYLSATPFAEHLGLLYHQFKLSDWSPFKKYVTFYQWFREYGKSHKTRTPYGLVETYTKYQDEKILKEIEHLFNYKTRAEVGIEHEPQTNVIVVKPSEETLELVKQLDREILTVGGRKILIESDMKQRTLHYQIEGSAIKVSDTECYYMKSMEKINYIKANYDTKNIAIMANFVCERNLLRANIPDALILSADGHSEGVDLSHIDKLIIYSMSFKTSKHQQRLARQANHNRTKPIIVDILVMDKPLIGKAVYETVAVKRENFVKNSYERIIG